MCLLFCIKLWSPLKERIKFSITWYLYEIQALSCTQQELDKCIFKRYLLTYMPVSPPLHQTMSYWKAGTKGRLYRSPQSPWACLTPAHVQPYTVVPPQILCWTKKWMHTWPTGMKTEWTMIQISNKFLHSNKRKLVQFKKWDPIIGPVGPALKEGNLTYILVKK